MTNLMIEIGVGKRVELTLNDYLIFVGGNIELKNNILQTLKNKSARYKANDLEKVSIQEELAIEFSGKELTSRNNRIIYLGNPDDLINEVSIERKSLIYENLISFQEDFEVNEYIEVLNNVMLSLESHLSEYSDGLSTRLNITLEDISYSKIIQTFAHVSYVSQAQDVPLTQIPIEKLIHPFLDLLSMYVEKTGEMVWVVLDGLDRFLEDSHFLELTDGLNKIYEKSRLVHYFIFNGSNLSKLGQVDSENIVTLYREYQQLPEFDILANSIARHYPTSYIFSKTELMNRILAIVDYIGVDVRDVDLIGGRNMVLLGVLKELLDDDSKLETSSTKLSSGEISYLENISTST